MAGDWEDGSREKRVVVGWDKLPVAFISEEGRCGVVGGIDCEMEVIGDWEEDVGEVGSLLGRKGSQSWRFWFSQR